ncbi:MAG TPA: tetratricopeptide repeat protein [Xanthomonadaceae bacterium]|nr:tetratricopeptide repeat protein [Xanthomonadaceae bacterium]
MSVPFPPIVEAMQKASSLLQAGNFALARSTLEQILQIAPRFVEAHRLLAGALLALDDFAGAERVLRTAVAIDARWSPAQCALGELLANSGRTEEAEHALRLALASGPYYPRAALVLAEMLNAANRYQETLDITAPFAAAPQPDLDLLTKRAVALTALDRHDEALSIYRHVVAALPNNPVGELNLAAALDSAGEHRDAVAAASRAIGKGADTPEAHYVHARALTATNRFDEAAAAFREAIRLRPIYADAQRHLAALIWMRSGDLAAASEQLDAALRQHPDEEALHIIKANLLDGSGDAMTAHAWLANRANRPGAGIALLLSACKTASKFDPQLALDYARRAMETDPRHPLANHMLADTLLGVGEAHEAQQLVEQLLHTAANDQHLIALQTTAWRLLGDARYTEFCDYAQMALSWIIDTPLGWSDLDGYLRDLAASLHRLHTLHMHPLHQTLRHGSQTAENLLRSDDPAIRAFFASINTSIRRYVDTVGCGGDPLRRRNTGEYRIKGAWSVRLRATGYHLNHVHPEGWLSSAFYVELPGTVLDGSKSGDDREGWLKFGEPGMRTEPPLAPEYFIRPEPGLLTLFPSYFWHGTVPFNDNGTRLSIAFDVVPT